MAGLMGIGLSGILSHQTALNTTGNNITNANTEGYSRQEVQFATQEGQRTGAGSIGSGVTIENIRRLADDYLNQQIREDSSLYGEQEALNTELTRLDNLLGGDTTGLSDALNNFFAALQSASEDPTSLPQRQAVEELPVHLAVARPRVGLPEHGVLLDHHAVVLPSLLAAMAPKRSARAQGGNAVLLLKPTAPPVETVFGRLEKADPSFPVKLFWPNQGDRGVHVNLSGIGLTKHPSGDSSPKLPGSPGADRGPTVLFAESSSPSRVARQLSPPLG